MAAGLSPIFGPSSYRASLVSADVLPVGGAEDLARHYLLADNVSIKTLGAFFFVALRSFFGYLLNASKSHGHLDPHSFRAVDRVAD